MGLLDPLYKTLRYAVNEIPYYKRNYPKCEKTESILELLCDLPLLNKSLAIENQELLRRSSSALPTGRISSGTTRRGSDFLDVHYTDEEYFATCAFMVSGMNWDAAYDSGNWSSEKVRQIREGSDSPACNDHPRILLVHNLHYEIPPDAHDPNVIQVGWSHHPNIIQRLENLLKVSPADGGVERMEIEAGSLIKMTWLLSDRNFDFTSSHLKTIAILGFITDRWRSWLEHHWSGCGFVEVYSLSEFRQRAHECIDGGHFHFASEDIPIVTEVLDVKSGKNIIEGVGELVLTPLYPFVQNQLLLRYATGDLVKIVPCEYDNTLGFRWMGRKSHCVCWNELRANGSMICERDVMDIVDQIPEALKTSDDFEALGIIPEGSVGWPAFRIEASPGDGGVIRACLHVSLKNDPDLFLERKKQIKDYIFKGMNLKNPDIRDAESKGNLKLDIELHGPDDDRENLKAWNEYDRIFGFEE